MLKKHLCFLILFFITGEIYSQIYEPVIKAEPCIKSAAEIVSNNELETATHSTQENTTPLPVQNKYESSHRSMENESIPGDFVKFLKTNNSLMYPALTVTDNYTRHQTKPQNSNYNSDIIPDTAAPAMLVQRQVEAYNARNINAFLEPYADDVEIYSFPDKLLAKGKEMMKEQYGNMFNHLPNLHCEIKNRIIFGDTVIDHENISGIKESEILEAIAIYKIANNKIAKVYLLQ